MDQQSNSGAVDFYAHNSASQLAPSYPRSQGGSGVYYPGPYSGYPHPYQQPQHQHQHPYPVSGQIPYDNRGNSHFYQSYHYHPYQPPLSYPSSTPVPYSHVPNAPGYYQGTTFGPGFSYSANYQFQQGHIYHQGQAQYPAEMPGMSSSDSGQVMRVESHNLRSPDETVPQISQSAVSMPMPMSAPVPGSSSRPSRPLVATVAPFEPSSTRKNPSTDKRNPLPSGSITSDNSQSPQPFEYLQTERPKTRDFAHTSQAQPCMIPAMARHAMMVTDAPGRGRTGGGSVGGDSKISSRWKEIPGPDSRSRPINTKQVGDIPQVTRAPITAIRATQAIVASNTEAPGSDCGTRLEPTEPVDIFDDGVLLAIPARPGTGSSEYAMGHHPIHGRPSTASDDSTTNYINSHFNSSVVSAPPGIECSDECRLQNLMVMAAEAEMMDRLTAQRIKNQTEIRQQESIGNGGISNMGLYTNDTFQLWTNHEMVRHDSGHSKVERHLINSTQTVSGTVPWDTDGTFQMLSKENEYIHILSNPNHEFWDVPPNSRLPPVRTQAADPQTQQLVSIFERVFKNLSSYADGYYNFQDAPVPFSAGAGYVEGRLARHQANWVDRRGIPDWDIPDVHDNIQIHRDFRNNACHVPYMEPLETNPPQHSRDSAMTTMPRMDMAPHFESSNPLHGLPQGFSSTISENSTHFNETSIPCGSIDHSVPEPFSHTGISALPRVSIYPNSYGNTITQDPQDPLANLANPANYYDFLGVSTQINQIRLSQNPDSAELPPRIMIASWEPDQTPRPSFADCIRSPRPPQSIDGMDFITDTTLGQHPPCPPHPAACGISLARYGAQALNGTPTPLPRGRNRRRW